MWWCTLALAQGLDEQAERMMDLDFDLKAVEQKVSRKAPAARPAADQVQTVEEEVPALPLEANSTLRSVVVYRDRALVTRAQTVELAVGPHTVTFEGLPHGASTDGLTAAVEKGGARIVSVELVSRAGEVEDGARTEAIRKDAERLVDQLGDVRDRIESLLAERQLLRTALVPSGATSGLPVAQVQGALRFVSDAERRIAHDLRTQIDAADDLAEKLQPLLIKLDDPHATGIPVRVDLDVQKPGPITLALAYTVAGAGWSPSYSARLDLPSGAVELEMFGVVVQRSHEDWSQAQITLSTADLAGHGSLQRLDPWWLGGSGGVGVYGSLDVGATTGPAPAAPEGAPADGQVIFAIDGPRTIRGDGSPQRLPMLHLALDGTLQLTTVPKLAPEVVRRATVRYTGALPLLPGPIASFVGADYVGTDQIGGIVPGERLDIGFGADDRFRVTRQLVTRQSERLGRKTRYTFRFRTVVQNHGAAPASVVVRDQLPLAEDTRIEVRVLAATPGATIDSDQRYAWTVDVPARGEVALELGFSVTVPDELSYAAAPLEEMMR